MTGAEALALLKEGKRVRRSWWSTSAYAQVDGPHNRPMLQSIYVYTGHDTGEYDRMPASQLLNDDWVEVP